MKKITMNAAVYEYIGTGQLSSLAGLHFISSIERNDQDVVRISEWREIEFEAIQMDSIIPELIKNIDDQIARIKEEAIEKCSKLQGQKAELLAITEGMSNAN